MQELETKKALATFSPADTAIAEMAERYLPLVVDGLKDTKGLAVVHEARMDVKRSRVAVEKTRKALKSDALEFGRQVDGEAKRIVALLEPIESHLKAEEDRISAEKERIKREKEEARRAALQTRMDALAELGSPLLPLEVEAMTDGEFGEELHLAREAKEERDRLAAEERTRLEAEARARAAATAKAAAEHKAEEERLAAERARLAEEQAKVDAERKQAAEDRAKLEAEIARMEEEARARAKEDEAMARGVERSAENMRKLTENGRFDAMRVDDEPDTAESFYAICQEFGCTTAADLRAALQLWNDAVSEIVTAPEF